jgi:hypothetical protein
MPLEVATEIEDALASASAPLTVHEIAEKVGFAPDEIAEVVWGLPQSFSWQPGGRWTLAVPKAMAPPMGESGHEDARSAVLSPQQGVELRAIRLESGNVLRVTRRPLDGTALFSVKALGSDLELVLNASHEAFARLPVPFDDEDEGDYKHLVELLLAAWAIYEGECPSAAKRSLEDARLFWGRRLIELLDAET